MSLPRVEPARPRWRPFAGAADLPWPWLGAFLAVELTAIFVLFPAPTVWFDELFVYTTAHDFAHLGRPNVPHANFLFYPPLTALLTAPLHWLDIHATWVYRLSLGLISTLLLSSAVAMLLLYRELSSRGNNAVGNGRGSDQGRPPGLLVALLLLGPVAYFGFTLMSEPLFIASYCWFLLFLYRYLRDRRWLDALGVSVAASLMILGRGTAVGILALAIPFAVLDLLVLARARRRAPSQVSEPAEGVGAVGTGRALLGHLVMLTPPLLVYLLWQWAHGRWQDPGNSTPGASAYLRFAVDAVREDPSAGLWLVHKMVGNLAYVSAATFGVALPLACWLLWLRYGRGASTRSGRTGTDSIPTDARQRDTNAGGAPGRALLLLLAHAAAFAVFAAFAAALHMFFFGGGDASNLKYRVYGRYMEYFAPLLWVLAWLAIEETGRRWGGERSEEPLPQRPRRILIACGALLAGATLAFLPSGLLGPPGSPGFTKVVPNHQGLGWAAVLFEPLPGYGLACVLGALLVGALLFWATARRPSRRQGGAESGAALEVRRELWIALLLLCLCQALVGPWQSARASANNHTARARLSEKIHTEPELYGSGFYVDVGLRNGRPLPLALFLAYMDHLDLAFIGSDPGAHRREMPIWSIQGFSDLEVLDTLPFSPSAKARRRARKRGERLADTIYLYGTEHSGLGFKFPLFADGFESGTMEAWSAAANRPRREPPPGSPKPVIGTPWKPPSERAATDSTPPGNKP